MNRRLAAWSVMVTYVVAAAAGILAQPATDMTLAEGVGLYLGFGLFGVLGALLLVRRPGHVMGVLFSAMALVIAIGSSGDAYAASILLAGRQPSLAVRLWAWPNAWYWYALLGVLVIYVPLLFPDGRLPSRRWRWFAWPIGVAAVVACISAAVSERITLQSTGPNGDFLSVVNPFGIPGVPHAEQNPVFLFFGGAYFAGLAGAVVAVIVRFRRSGGVERQQLKWFVSAVCVLVVGVVLDELPIPGAGFVGGVGFVVGVVGVPASITLAILRFRLYEIDRIISRTVTYAIVTAVLFAIYSLIVTLPGAVFALQSDLLVAAATLAAAAVFVPVRRGVQQVVDRHFNRARYDAQHVIVGFGTRLRDEVDLASLTTELRGVVAGTVQPTQVSLWLRDGGDA